MKSDSVPFFLVTSIFPQIEETYCENIPSPVVFRFFNVVLFMPSVCLFVRSRPLLLFIH